MVYLDHAGATLYADSQIRAVMENLHETLYGNPHSQSDSSISSSNAVACARQEVLRFFNAPAGEYSCVFTSGATAALKIVGETFPWSSKSHYLYTMENHNSVLGIREYALAVGATAHAVDIRPAAYGRECSALDNCDIWDFKLKPPQRRTSQDLMGEETEGPVYNLFAFPSECNFSGEKFSLDLVKYIQGGGHMDRSLGEWMVLIDAAKGCGTSPFDLSKYPADFVAISFYKIFGYPTGVGALLVRNDTAGKLQKKYFGGGTVAASVADVDFVQKRKNVEQWLEDGTVPFLGIVALQHGFATVNKIGFCNIMMHVGCLAKFTASKLSTLRHENGKIVCILYGKHEPSNDHSVSHWGDNCSQGSIVTFNLKHSDGTWVGYREVEKLASLNGIHLRTGCFCNPGACSKFLGLSELELRANYEAGRVCWDDNDIIGGKPIGAIRASFGYMSTIEDSLALLDFISKYFVDDHTQSSDPRLKQRLYTCTPASDPSLLSQGQVEGRKKRVLELIIVYPIKSCAGFKVVSWPLGDCGLLYDREWLIMGAAGDILTQKKYPAMCLIGTYIDLAANKLLVTSPKMRKKLEVSIHEMSHCGTDVGFELCADRSKGKMYGKEISEWFTEALDTPCTLVRKEPRSRQTSTRGPCDSHTCRRDLSFANEGQFLLVSRASLEDLNQRISSSVQVPSKAVQYAPRMQVDVMQFRPNFVISGGSPYEEDCWQSLSIGTEKFSVLGGCNRCEMVNIDQKSGISQRSSHPLLTLASYRRFKGKIVFGVLLVHDSPHQGLESIEGSEYSRQPQSLVRVGCPVYSKSTVD